LDFGKETPQSPMFCMTVFALKLSAYLNGVAKLHGVVSREMWKNIWPGLSTSEVPITSITNGIHPASWVSHEHSELYRKYLYDGNDSFDSFEQKTFDKVDNIPAQELWATHNIRKDKLIKYIRTKAHDQAVRLASNALIIKQSAKVLKEGVLTIGFARRFATYKRATLLFKDLDRLSSIVNNPERPVQFVFAGKAHPADTAGKEFIKQIFNIMLDPRFKGKIVFAEDYNMNLARYMVQGVDVWLNNPVRPMEASGTSGMKAALNGALALSILDGWWDEVGPCDFSWSIIGAKSYQNDQQRDEVESQALYNLLEQEVVPCYYNKDADGLPQEWIKKMKTSIKTIVPFFNTNRMVQEYYERFYSKAHYYGNILRSEGQTAALAAWRNRIAANWARVSVVDTTGNIDRTVLVGETLKFTAKVTLGDLKPEDVVVQIQMGQRALGGGFESTKDFAMVCKGKEGDTYLYEIEIHPETSGRQDYAMRIIPFNKAIPNPFTPIYVRWEM